MSQRKCASKSTYRAILSVQAERDDVSGLRVSDRYFEPSVKKNTRTVLWNIADVCWLAVLVSGLLMLVTEGLQIPAGFGAWISVFAVCVFCVALCKCSFYKKYSLLCNLAVLIIWLGICFVLQARFLHGMHIFADCISVTAHRAYGDAAAQSVLSLSSSELSDVRMFTALSFVPVIFWLAASVLRIQQMLMVYMVVFPVVAALALVGASCGNIGLILVLVGILLGRVYVGTRIQNRMWGKGKPELYSANVSRFEKIQKLSSAAALAVFIVLFIPGYFIVRPLLSVSMKPLETMSMRVQSSFLSKAVKILPDVSAGRLNLSVSSVGSGVDEGSLNNDEGYMISGVEDLKVTVDTKPEETVFLKGFVGSIYSDGEWKTGYGTTFDAAAMNWNTDGSPRLYVQNLPFLRTSYVLEHTESDGGAVAGDASSENDGGTASEDVSSVRIGDTASEDVSSVRIGGTASENASLEDSDSTAAPNSSASIASSAVMWVERLNANDKYTYVPYGAYLNDYYTVEAGDGCVDAQNAQEDQYPFYFRKDIENVLSDWLRNDDSENANVMDRVEESYRAYCESSCVSTYESVADMNALADYIDNTATEHRWKGQQNLDDITAWISSYLDEGYEYVKEGNTSPDGVDSLDYFLFTSKKGNSVQFASAAVIMYRMFGIPARYVVGYEIPYSMFTAQPDGTYTVTATGENSQAWAEVYVYGIGWMPEDVTPGVMGSYDEVGPGGELVTQNTEASSMSHDDTASEKASDNLQNSQDASHFRNISMGQIVKRLAICLAIAAFIFAVLLFVRWYCYAFGYTFAGRRTRRQRLIGEFSAFYKKMRRLGLPENVSSQDAEFVTFCESMLPGYGVWHKMNTDEMSTNDSDAGYMSQNVVKCVPESEVVRMTERLYDVCFGGESATEDDVLAMRSLVRASYHVKKRRGK